jgi:ubiquinone/menaquinone biosynthesis C-methylase UbiE
VTRTSCEDAVVLEYARSAADYDRRWSDYVERSIAQTLRRLPEHEYERIADVGCGTCTFLASLAVRFPSAQLIGVDLSQEMLRVGRTKLSNAAAVCRGRAQQLPLQSASCDLVVSLSALHHVGGVECALRESYRVLRPGGVILLTDWCRDFFTTRSFDRVWHWLGKASFRMLSGAGCEQSLRRAGYTAVTVDTYRIDWFWGLMTACARKPSR